MQCTYPSIRLSPGVGTLKITVGCPPCTRPSIRTKLAHVFGSFTNITALIWSKNNFLCNPIFCGHFRRDGMPVCPSTRHAKSSTLRCRTTRRTQSVPIPIQPILSFLQITLSSSRFGHAFALAFAPFLRTSQINFSLRDSMSVPHRHVLRTCSTFLK